MRTLPIVGVMGSGTERHDELAEGLGRWIAERGCHLLTGGGQGVMRAVSEAFVGVTDRAGLCIGVVPGRVDERGARHPDGYPNPAVELAIRTHLPLSGERGTESMSRNHINVLSAHAIVALPGGAGTRSEAMLAERYGVPIVLYGPRQSFAAFPTGMARATTLHEVRAFVDAALGLR